MHAALTFLGGAQTVTGSKILFEGAGHRLLIDCGLFQGLKDLRLLNRQPFPVDPKTLDAVIITHAHLDHTGYLPLLVNQGFTGNIFSTEPTRTLAEIILLDASHLQVEEASRAHKGGYSKHENPTPLFTPDDVKRAMGQFRSVSPGEWQSLPGAMKFQFLPNGHILGSAFVDLRFKRQRFFFTGDLGRRKPLLFPPAPAIKTADYLIIESTYGDRRHSKEPVLRSLSRILHETFDQGGDVLIPSFAVGRSQDLLHLLAQLKREHGLPKVPIFFDSPMGIEAMRALGSYAKWHRLTAREFKDLSEVATIVPDKKLSLSIASSRKQKIIIAGSGMLTGGRALNYLESHLTNRKNTVLFAGYQAAGTRGRLLRDGAPEIKVFGSYVQVKARIAEISGLSAHADSAEIMAWLRNFTKPPRQTLLVHGEPQSSDALRVKIENALGWNCHIPQHQERLILK